MTNEEKKIQFAEAVLNVLDNTDEWGGDTLIFISESALNLDLAYNDDKGFFKRKEEMTFKLTNDSANGTCLQGYVVLKPAALVRRFGEPQEGDGYKVSGEYIFEDSKGNIYTLYDWKSTTLYDCEAALRPSELWASEELFKFNIGGSGAWTNWQDFKTWIANELKGV
jgi:hypothetical protein